MTLLNTLIWASAYEPTRDLMRSFSISAVDMFTTIFFMLGLLIMLGMFIRSKLPTLAMRLNKFMSTLSIVIFLAFVVIMLMNNWDVFSQHLGSVFSVVVVLNAFAIFIGYSMARLAKVSDADRRAIAIEIGIQNSGLGLVLIFIFIDGLGGMAMVAAWSGIWHIVSSLIVAFIWSRKELMPSFSASMK